MLIPCLRTLFGEDAKIGVITYDAAVLKSRLPSKDEGHRLSIHGLDPDGELYQCICNNRTELSEDRAEQDAMNAAECCLDANPDTRLLLLECTNLSAWKDRIKSRFGVPVFDLVDALEWVDGAFQR